MNTLYKRTYKKVGTLLTLLLISIFISSCGDDPVVNPDKPEPKPEEPQKVKRLVFIGSCNTGC